MKSRNITTWIGVIILIAIEQTIKIIINNNYFYSRFPILPPILYFEPMFNRRYSWFNSMLKLGYGRWIHVILAVVMIILMYLFYNYLNKQFGNNILINVMFAFIFSGAMCSLIDKVFWNGSLDYILVNGFFTFDLKDVYIDVFIGLLLLSSLIHRKALQQISDKDLITGFTKYILRKS